MFNSWKSPFRSLAGGGWGRSTDPADAEPEAGAAGQTERSEAVKAADASILRLRSVMAELKGGEARQNGSLPAERIERSEGGPRPAAAEEPVAQEALAAAEEAPPAAAAQAAPAVQATPVSNGVPASSGVPASNGAAASNGAPVANGVANAGEKLTEAQRLAAEQRKAAEALLLEAYVLEERLKHEAKAAQVSGQCAAAKAKLEQLAAAERDAKEASRKAAEMRGTLAAERRDAEAQVAAARGEVKTARGSVMELEQQLRDAKQAVEQTLSMVGLRESRVKECLAKEASIKRDGADATARVVACENARVEAEKQLKAAEERAEALKSELPPSQDFAGLGDVRALAARIANQATAFKRTAHAGVVEPEQAATAG